jgi:cytoskeletal protein RodZ
MSAGVMADEQDEDALFERLAKNLEAIRRDADLVRASGTEGITANLAHTEAELAKLSSGLAAVHDRLDQLEAAAARSDEDYERLRQTVNLLSRQIEAQGALLSPPPSNQRSTWIVLLLVLVLLGGGAAAWIASGREPTVGTLAHQVVQFFSDLTGVRLAAEENPTRPDQIAAQATPAPVPLPPPSAAPPSLPAPSTAPDMPAADASAATPTPSPPPMPAQEAATAPPPAEAKTQTAPSSLSVPPVTAPAAQTEALVTPAPPVAPPEPPPPADASPAPDIPRLVLRATATTWVQVRQKSGHPLFLRTMKPGDIWVVPVEPGLTLDTGNADGLDLVVEGTPLRLVGGAGGVVHGVSLDGDLLGSGRAVRAPR